MKNCESCLASEYIMPFLSLSGSAVYGHLVSNVVCSPQVRNSQAILEVKANPEIKYLYTGYTQPVAKSTDRVHIPTATRSTRLCSYCREHRVLTANGCKIYSTYRCDLCDVTLCNGKRNCFEIYHKALGLLVCTTGGQC